MTTDDGDRDPRLSPADEAFVRRIASAYAPPRPSAPQRAAFMARLDARFERSRRRRQGGALVAAAAAALAAFALLHAPSQAPPAQRAAAPGAGSAQAEAILALAIAQEPASDAALPEDYEAIAGVLLGG